ncbi:hypothetical protein, partial [uncultured Butyricimonas sp.]|uniref:hypothetical protein n=1 Tax=uncultured Butyricimonas sp. TaxID=1268785 RepID=UPI002594FB8A
DKPLDFVATDISLLVEQVNFFRIRQFINTCFITLMVRCYSIVWLGFLRVFSVLSPCHLRVIAGENTFECGMNQNGVILKHRRNIGMT